ncbi:MAG TPA: MoxR family ATPase [Chloroflexota bacterium]|nr:MoxR family ATPase [Chloroflexota bacterium]
MQQAALDIQRELATVIVGYEDVLRGVLIALLAGGNTLLEGAPGLGKTLLVRTLGQIMQLKYSRIQFTPDLMPADIIGTNVLVESDTGHRRFVFQQGPVFGNVVLADEINRASPKTQSALLEAMQESSVTVGIAAYPLPQPFFVLATQNPIEMAGTYPLPEAQLDRFLFKLNVAFPSNADLTEIVLRTTAAAPYHVRSLADATTVLEMQRVARQVPVASSVLDYAVRLVAATQPTRPEAPRLVRDNVRYGASPRGAQGLVLAAKITAFLDGRLNVSYDDVRSVAEPVLRHRLILNVDAEVGGVEADGLIAAVLGHVAEELAG